MKLNEVIVQHPGAEKHKRFLELLHNDVADIDEVIEYVMDDNNIVTNRVRMLQHLDELLGDTKGDRYGVDDLRDFMKDPDNPVKRPHLSLVKETDFDPEYNPMDVPTGEYEICANCSGEGCEECEFGMNDVTGVHQTPDFTDLDLDD